MYIYIYISLKNHFSLFTFPLFHFSTWDLGHGTDIPIVPVPRAILRPSLRAVPRPVPRRALPFPFPRPAIPFSMRQSSGQFLGEALGQPSLFPSLGQPSLFHAPVPGQPFGQSCGRSPGQPVGTPLGLRLGEPDRKNKKRETEKVKSEKVIF